MDAYPISIVVPVYNSELSLNELTGSISEHILAVRPGSELIFVDDGSRDDSWQIVTELCGRFPWARGIRLTRNFGQHNALMAGIRAARHDVIVTMDDDLQHPPQEVEHLLERLTPEYDVVYGVPQEDGHGQLRSSASRLVKLSLAATLRSPIARNVSAFRAFRSSIAQGFLENADPGLTLDVLLSWTTSRMTSVPVRIEQRRYGQSNYSFARLVKHALNMITGYSTVPLRIVTYLGMLFTVFGSAILVYVVARYAVTGSKVPGFTFLAALVAVFSGAQTFALGVLGEYLGRVHMRSMHKPQYLVRERIGGQPRTSAFEAETFDDLESPFTGVIPPPSERG